MWGQWIGRAASAGSRHLAPRSTWWIATGCFEEYQRRGLEIAEKPLVSLNQKTREITATKKMESCCFCSINMNLSWEPVEVKDISTFLEYKNVEHVLLSSGLLETHDVGIKSWFMLLQHPRVSLGPGLSRLCAYGGVVLVSWCWFYTGCLHFGGIYLIQTFQNKIGYTCQHPDLEHWFKKLSETTLNHSMNRLDRGSSFMFLL